MGCDRVSVNISFSVTLYVHVYVHVHVYFEVRVLRCVMCVRVYVQVICDR